jgi:poly-gamma-glutamate synthase PgsB/CapB
MIEVIGLWVLMMLVMAGERYLHERNLRRIPLRITVSGTRGKTTVVRMLASVMREAGHRVMAKTTGSEAMYILPDGSEEPVFRRGRVSIMEQKKLVARAARLNSDCLIAEIMSIRPENHAVETRTLIRPGVTLLTNFRADHLNVSGPKTEEVARLHGNDLNPGSRLIIPASEVHPVIREKAMEAGVEIIEGITDSGIPDAWGQPVADHIALVRAASRELGISDATIEKGILNAKMDIGRPRIFRMEGMNGPVWFVSTFAANEPVSTVMMMDRVLAIPGIGQATPVALLCLRRDRPERSQQWLRWLMTDGKDRFEKICVIGPHAPLFTRKIRNAIPLDQPRNPKDAELITRQLTELVGGQAVVFGLANLAGTGKEMIKAWETLCTEYKPGEA